MDEVSTKKKRRKKKKKKNIPVIVDSSSIAEKQGYSCLKVVTTSRMMYAHCLVERWREGHILSNIPASLEGALELVAAIHSEGVQDTPMVKTVSSQSQGVGDFEKLTLNVESSKQNNREVCEIPIVPFKKEYLEDLEKILHRMLVRHKRCYYRMYTKYFLTKMEGGPTIEEKTLKPIEHKYITHFVIAVCVRILPKELLGRNPNWNHFKRMLHTITHSAHHQEFRLGTFVRGFKLRTIVWLKKIPNFFMKTQILAQVVLWLLKYFVMDLISNHFYVTDVLGGRNELSFYWKPTWQRIQAAGIRKMTDEGKIMQISEEEANIVNNFYDPTFRLSRLRLIPKGNNAVRPVSKINFSNKVLAMKVHYLLQQFVRLEVKGRFTTGQLHKQYRDIVDNTPQGTKLYFVRTDISDAFGSIDHFMLRKVLDNLRSKYMGGTTSNCLTLLKLPVMEEGETKKLKKIVYYYTNNKMKSGYEDYVEIKNNNSSYFNGYVQETGVSGSALLDYVNAATCNTVLEAGGRLRLLLTGGIPQGGRWSPALCDLYYAAMDDAHLAPFGRHGMLTRTVDDYLFITTDESQARRFKNRMEEGFPDFNCYVNEAKTQTNLDNQTDTITFCGTSFNTDTLEVSADYAIYKDQDMRYSMKLNTESRGSKRDGRRVDEQETFLAVRLKLFTALRLGSHLFDQTYNSKARVLANFFHACLFLAFRAHAIVRQVYTATPLNQKFVMKNIGSACTRVAKCVHRLVHTNYTASDITMDMLLWLAYKSFYWKLVRNGAHYSYCIRGTRMVLQKTANRLDPVELQYLEKQTQTVPNVFLTMC